MAILGHTYDEQYYFSIAHRTINNEFLNNACGVIDGQGSACEVTYEGNTLTINDGFIIVQGGIIEIEGSENINANLNNSYCILVLEVDMSASNDEEFSQAKFKIISEIYEYPTLTQENLTKNDGIYQLELARFFASASGIENFEDTRPLLLHGNFAWFSESEEWG